MAPPAANYPSYAQGGFADGLFGAGYDGGHIDEVLQVIDGIGMAGFQSAFDLGRFRLSAYASFARQEIANHQWEDSWRIIKVEWRESIGPPPSTLDELLFTMAAYRLPGNSRTIVARIQEAAALLPANRLRFEFHAALGSVLLASGNSAEAETQFAPVRRDAATLDNHGTGNSLVVWQILIHAYAAAGDLGRASELFEQFFPPTTDVLARSRRWLALREIALAAVQTGKPEEALRIAEGATYAIISYEVTDQIVRAFADQGNFRDAEYWARKLAAPGIPLERHLAYIAARAACASSSDARWIVIFRGERDLARFPMGDHAFLPPACQ